MLILIPFTNLGAKWGTWLMVCVLSLSGAPPSSAMALGSRHIRGSEDILGNQPKTDLEGAEARHTPTRTLSCRAHRGLFLFDYHSRVPRQTQAIEASGGMGAQGRRRSLWVGVRQGCITNGLQQRETQARKGRDSTLFWSACVLTPGLVHQELPGAKAQISFEDSLCPGLRNSALGAARTPSLPFPSLLFWYGPASVRASLSVSRGLFHSPVS